MYVPISAFFFHRRLEILFSFFYDKSKGQLDVDRAIGRKFRSLCDLLKYD